MAELNKVDESQRMTVDEQVIRPYLYSVKPRKR
jgi:hypothetical protein